MLTLKDVLCDDSILYVDAKLLMTDTLQPDGQTKLFIEKVAMFNNKVYYTSNMPFY